MTRREATTEEWIAWIDLQKEATQAWATRGAPSEAISLLERFLDSHPPKDLRRDALVFRGTLQQQNGNLEAAKSDLLKALEISREERFPSYSIETSLAALSIQRGETGAAEEWCLAALQTAAEDPTESGAGSLLRLLELRGERGLSIEERQLAKKVVYQAWSLLRVEGEPDLTDLAVTAKKLLKARQGPFSADRPPTPKAYEEPAEDD